MGAMEKHAFLIIAHTDWSLLKTLVSLLDYELNDIYIHIDAKVPAKAIPDIICSKSNLYMLEHRISVAWGDISVVEAEYLLFEIAYNNSHYGYYHLLSGVDLPLKSKSIYILFLCSLAKNSLVFALTMIHFRIFVSERIIFLSVKCGTTDFIGC